MNYFKTEDKTSGEYKPVFTDALWNELGIGKMTSSWNVLFARLWGLQFPDFLRFVRQEFNATLCGKNSTYIYFYFSNKQDCDNFVNASNRLFNNWKKEFDEFER